jgi:hypothetical protein
MNLKLYFLFVYCKSNQKFSYVKLFMYFCDKLVAILYFVNKHDCVTKVPRSQLNDYEASMFNL